MAKYARHGVKCCASPVEITGKDSNAILIGEEDGSSIQETVYLASIPEMRASII